MLETLVVALIVAAVLFLAGRSLYRTLRGKTPGCQCCGNKGCRDRLDGMKSGSPKEIFPMKREGGK